MLTDTQLTELSEKMGIPLEAVLFKDEIPNKIKYNRSYIINIEDSEDKEGNKNDGTHWTCLQVNKYPNGKIEPFYFDAYGMPPPESIKKAVMDTCGQKIPFNTKDIQSLMNNACGWYCLALGHFINASKYRSGILHDDVAMFIDMFDDLNHHIDFKKNEYILKHFFRSEDPSLRKEIDVITSQDEKGGIDLMKVPVDVKIIGK